MPVAIDPDPPTTNDASEGIHFVWDDSINAETFTSDDIQIQVNGSDPAWITKSSPTKVSRTGGKTFLMTLSDLDDDEDDYDVVITVREQDADNLVAAIAGAGVIDDNGNIGPAVDQGPYSFNYDRRIPILNGITASYEDNGTPVSVSYTHLTLPTKA